MIAVVEVMSETMKSTVRNKNTEESMEPRTGGPVLKQPTFDWAAKEKYIEPKTLEVEEQTFS